MAGAKRSKADPKSKQGKRPARSDAEWWDERRRAAFEAVRAGQKEPVVCRLSGVSRTTLHRWQSDPRWQKELEDRKAVILARAIKREEKLMREINQGCRESVRVWRSILADFDADPKARNAAGRNLWDVRFKLEDRKNGAAEGGASQAYQEFYRFYHGCKEFHDLRPPEA